MKPFPLDTVRLLSGPFESAQARAASRLRMIDADGLLHGFRLNAGLKPKTPRQSPEADDLQPGHTLGRYLSACAAMWAATGEQAFWRRVDHVVEELRHCQQSASSGLVCAFPDGDVPLRHALYDGSLAGAPWCAMHDLMAGLRDAHVHARHPRALPVLARLANWIADAADGREVDLRATPEHPHLANADARERELFGGALTLQDSIGSLQDHARLGDSIYFHDDQALYVNLFIASTLHWALKRVRLRQTTTFPKEASTRLWVQLPRPTRFALRLRHPAWCRKLTIRLNGRRLLESTEPGRHVEVERLWRQGDVVDAALPMHLYLQPAPGASGLATWMRGPLVFGHQPPTMPAMPPARPTPEPEKKTTRAET
ncbi:MAG TPA: beta-L-arabinofuranosidase domain-containing protein [Ideonella sp.]|jgi:DUF1680 family protein|nr:beta-L-arabinofuranosidase domain-containing protein [Ideonella sp.]